MTVTEPRAAVETADVRPGWWHEPFDMFQTNLREIDALLDVETVLDAIEEHGAGVWLLNVGGILSHFPSTLPFQSIHVSSRSPIVSTTRVSPDHLADEYPCHDGVGSSGSQPCYPNVHKFLRDQSGVAVM